MTETKTDLVTMYFDVACPFAWVTSRWLKEVEKVRDITVSFAPMSLSVLNDGRELNETYTNMMAAAWAPARVTAAVYTEYPEKTDAYYTAIGEKIHNDQRVDNQELGGYDEVIAEVLAELNLPADLAEAADKASGQEGNYEDALRQMHSTAVNLVGDDVGTPVVQFGETAFFGPVLTRIPTGEQAGKIFDAAVELSSYPHFFELKRSRTEDPVAEEG